MSTIENLANVAFAPLVNVLSTFAEESRRAEFANAVPLLGTYEIRGAESHTRASFRLATNTEIVRPSGNGSTLHTDRVSVFFGGAIDCFYRMGTHFVPGITASWNVCFVTRLQYQRLAAAKKFSVIADIENVRDGMKSRMVAPENVRIANATFPFDFDTARIAFVGNHGHGLEYVTENGVRFLDERAQQLPSWREGKEYQRRVCHESLRRFIFSHWSVDRKPKYRRGSKNSAWHDWGAQVLQFLATNIHISEREDNLVTKGIELVCGSKFVPARALVESMGDPLAKAYSVSTELVLEDCEARQTLPDERCVFIYGEHVEAD